MSEVLHAATAETHEVYGSQLEFFICLPLTPFLHDHLISSSLCYSPAFQKSLSVLCYGILL